MSIARGLLVLCGLGLSVPALAQQAHSAFEYSPVARLLQNGQYRAEVWRRDVYADRSEIAWSEAEPSLTAVMAITEACASIKQNFDPSFHCPHAATPHEGATFKGPSPPSQHKLATTRTSARPPPPMASPNSPVLQSSGSTWLKNFWKVQDSAAGGGSGGDSGGGGGMP
jgi:hypothetical protein